MATLTPSDARLLPVDEEDDKVKELFRMFDKIVVVEVTTNPSGYWANLELRFLETINSSMHVDDTPQLRPEDFPSHWLREPEPSCGLWTNAELGELV